MSDGHAKLWNEDSKFRDGIRAEELFDGGPVDDDERRDGLTQKCEVTYRLDVFDKVASKSVDEEELSCALRRTSPIEERKSQIIKDFDVRTSRCANRSHQAKEIVKPREGRDDDKGPFQKRDKV